MAYRALKIAAVLLASAPMMALAEARTAPEGRVVMIRTGQGQDVAVRVDAKAPRVQAPYALTGRRDSSDATRLIRVGQGEWVQVNTR